MAHFPLGWALGQSMLVRIDELERGERSTLSLESMASSHTGRSPSVPRLLDVQEWGYQALGQGIWPAALALFLSVSTSILVFPFFPYVPSSGSFGDALLQVRLHRTHSQSCHHGCCCLLFCIEELPPCSSTMQHCCHTFALAFSKPFALAFSKASALAFRKAFAFVLHNLLH